MLSVDVFIGIPFSGKKTDLVATNNLCLKESNQFGILLPDIKKPNERVKTSREYVIYKKAN